MATAARLALLLAVSAMAPTPSLTPAQRSLAQRVLQRLAAADGRLHDFQAISDVTITGPQPNGPSTTFRLRVAAKMPDMVRMDVLRSSILFFNGASFARTGSKVWIRNPASEQVSQADVRQLTGREPIRLDLGLGMMGALANPALYPVTDASTTKLGGVPAYRIELKIASQAGAVVRLGRMVLWVDARRLVPLRQDTYTSNGRLFLSARFGDPRRVGPGLWVPGRVDVTHKHQIEENGEEPHTVTMLLARVNGVLVPTQLTARGPHGQTIIRYSDIKVNTGVPNGTFRLG
jgi:outer membrane lipoprotein-sorting protein